MVKTHSVEKNIFPIGLLDVDGVLNAEAPSADFNDWITSFYEKMEPDARTGELTLKRYMINTSYEMGQLLLSLPIRWMWLTDWGNTANQFISPLLGFPELPVFEPYFVGHHPKQWWKRHIVSSMTEPFAWIDDNIKMAEVGWNKHNNTINFKEAPRVPHIALPMNSPYGQPLANQGINKGLRLKDIELLEAWCKELK